MLEHVPFFFFINEVDLFFAHYYHIYHIIIYIVRGIYFGSSPRRTCSRENIQKQNVIRHRNVRFGAFQSYKFLHFTGNIRSLSVIICLLFETFTLIKIETAYKTLPAVPSFDDILILRNFNIYFFFSIYVILACIIRIRWNLYVVAIKLIKIFVKHIFNCTANIRNPHKCFLIKE